MALVDPTYCCSDQNMSMLIGEIAVPTLEELFISKIEEQIFTGRLKPGDKLPSERQLQEDTKISKTVIHAGLVTLEKNGFLEIKPRCGAFVTDYTKTGSLEALNAFIRHNGGIMTKKQASSFFDFRIAVEGMALRRVAKNHTDEMIAELEGIISEAEKVTKNREFDMNALTELMFKYQRAVCVFSGNEFFPLLMNEFKPIILRFWEVSVNNFGAEKNVRLARRFLNDIRSGDDEAAFQRLVRSSAEYINCYN